MSVVVQTDKTVVVHAPSGTVLVAQMLGGGGGGGGPLVMADITDKQGKVLDDLTPLLVDDMDSAVEPKGYLVSDVDGLFDGAQLFVQQTQEGLLLQTMHIPLLGKTAFRTKPVGGEWPNFAFTIAPFDIVGWHGNTTAEAANAVINANGAFSRSVSSDEFKTGIEPMLDEYADAIVQGAQPIYYRSTCDADPDDWSYWGISAEQLATVDPRLVHWGHSTKEVPRPLGLPPKTVPDLESPLKPVGVQYSRIVPALLNVVKRQGALLAALEARVQALEALAGERHENHE